MAQAWTGGATPHGDKVTLGTVEVDRARGRVERGRQPIWLTASEEALLWRLLDTDGVVGREELLVALGERAVHPRSNAVAVHVSRLRRKLGAAAIATAPGGYRAARGDTPPT